MDLHETYGYCKTDWEKDFPSALEDHSGGGNTSAFHSALSPLLRELVEDEHIMRACSLQFLGTSKASG